METRLNVVSDLLAIGALASSLIGTITVLSFVLNLYYRTKRNLDSITGIKNRIAASQKDIARIEKYLMTNTDYAKKTNEEYTDY